jgi:hypothetical protein
MRSALPLTLIAVLGLAATLEAQTGLPAKAFHPSNRRIEVTGYWEAPVNHDFMPMPHINSIHTALIPEGPQRGRILSWSNVHTGGSLAFQNWAVLDFSVSGAPVFHNEVLTMPSNMGDLFCAGFAWTPDGKLFVAGGTSQYSDPQSGIPFLGGQLAYLYDPSDFSGSPIGTWNRQADMLKTRWYPTVVLLPDDSLLSLGGTSNSSFPGRNDYEAFTVDPQNPVSGSWQTHGPGSRLFNGPNPGPLDIYPRCHVLPNGELFMSGMVGNSALLDHPNAPGVWVNTPPSRFDLRYYGTSWLFPLIPGQLASVGIVAGRGFLNGTSVGLRSELEICQPEIASVWSEGSGIQLGRMYMDSTLLPDGTVLVTGGQVEDHRTRVPLLLEDGAWRVMALMASQREYHATALLLPDGRVFTCGGNDREWDYQVFVPPYLCRGNERPVITGLPALAGYRADGAPNLIVDHAAMSTDVVERAMLMRPGAVTHSFNVDQRAVQLEVVTQGATSIELRPPQNSAEAPRGWYMLFLLSNKGTPSEAGWVQFK